MKRTRTGIGDRSANQPGRPTRGEQMKWLKLIGVAVAVTIGVILYIGKDDMIRYREMRRM